VNLAYVKITLNSDNVKSSVYSNASKHCLVPIWCFDSSWKIDKINQMNRVNLLFLAKGSWLPHWNISLGNTWLEVIIHLKPNESLILYIKWPFSWFTVSWITGVKAHPNGALAFIMWSRKLLTCREDGQQSTFPSLWLDKRKLIRIIKKTWKQV
jgi:hypothetical protein